MREENGCLPETEPSRRQEELLSQRRLGDENARCHLHYFFISSFAYLFRVSHVAHQGSVKMNRSHYSLCLPKRAVSPSSFYFASTYLAYWSFKFVRPPWPTLLTSRRRLSRCFREFRRACQGPSRTSFLGLWPLWSVAQDPTSERPRALLSVSLLPFGNP